MLATLLPVDEKCRLPTPDNDNYKTGKIRRLRLIFKRRYSYSSKNPTDTIKVGSIDRESWRSRPNVRNSFSSKMSCTTFFPVSVDLFI